MVDSYMEWLNKFGRGKFYMIVMVFIIVISIIITNLMVASTKKFHADGKDFQLVEEDARNLVFNSTEGDRLEVNIADVMTWRYGFIGKIEFTYQDRTYIMRKKKYLGDIETTYENGDVMVRKYDYNSYMPVAKEMYLLKGIENVMTAYKKVSPMLALIPICAGTIILVPIIFPREVWEIQHFLVVAGGEPTDFALTMNVLGGVVGMILLFISFWGLT